MSGRIEPNQVWDEGEWLQYFSRKDWRSVKEYLEKMDVKPVKLSTCSGSYVATNHVISAIEKMARDELAKGS